MPAGRFSAAAAARPAVHACVRPPRRAADAAKPYCRRPSLCSCIGKGVAAAFSCRVWAASTVGEAAPAVGSGNGVWLQQNPPTHVRCCKGGCRWACRPSAPRVLRGDRKAASGGRGHGAGQRAAARRHLAAGGGSLGARQRLAREPRLQQPGSRALHGPHCVENEPSGAGGVVRAFAKQQERIQARCNLYTSPVAALASGLCGAEAVMKGAVSSCCALWQSSMQVAIFIQMAFTELLQDQSNCDFKHCSTRFTPALPPCSKRLPPSSDRPDHRGTAAHATMDVALRALREGRGDAAAAAPLLLLVDELGVAGGPALLRHVSCTLTALGKKA